MKTVKVKHAGPIEDAEFPFLPAGGVVVFRGRQGAGKSIALASVDVAVSGKGKVPVSDDHRAAEIEGFGVRVRIGSRVTRGGDSLAVSIEGKLSICDLVDPGIASAEAADAKRIKALVGLAGAKALIGMFDPDALVGKSKIEYQPETIGAPDLLTMAARVKRDCEASARRQENIAENSDGRAQAIRAMLEADDLADEWPDLSISDAQSALEAAITEHTAQKARGEAVARMAADAAAARLSLSNATRPDLEWHHARHKIAASAARDAAAKVEGLRKALMDAESELGKADAAAEQAQKDAASAEHAASIYDAWESTVARSERLSAEFDQSAIKSAESRLSEARAVLARAVMREKAESQRAELEAAEAMSRDARAAATEMRDAAKATDDVLSDAVQSLGTPLRVEAGRLVTETSRGKTLFSELSDGERWRMALEIVITQAAKLADARHTAVLTIPQAAWGELQPANRLWVAGRCAELGVCAYTAIATDDDNLCYEVLEGGDA